MRRRLCARMALTGVMLLTLFALSARTTPIVQAATSVRDIANPDAYTCAKPGYINFEDLPDNKNLSSDTISGVQFTTTGGFTWLVGDFSTGYYNGKYPAGAYTSQGTHWAWLGPSQGSGRIDFPQGKPSYFSLLVSGLTPVYLEAYNANGALLERAGPTASNTNTGHMGELAITRQQADIDHVIVHDTGNYFLIDAVCTDAASVPQAQVFRLPWVSGQWYYLQGPHDFLSSGFQNALDFAPNKSWTCSSTGPATTNIDDKHWIYPLAPGKVIQANPPSAESVQAGADPNKPVTLIIDHGNGYVSYMTHLANTTVNVGAHVDYKTPLGNPSCFFEKGGGATAAHVHIALKNTNQGLADPWDAIYAVQLCGWQVTRDQYNHPYNPLTRNGQMAYPFYWQSDKIHPNLNADYTGKGPDPVSNDNCPGSGAVTRVLDQTQPMQTGGSATGTFLVDVVSGAQQSINVFVGPFGSDVDLVLTQPDGSRVSPADPGVQYSKTSTSVSYAISDAPAGQWTYQIVANKLEVGGEDIRIVADEYNGTTPTPPDTTPPSITCGTADGLWHANDISISCTASDTESGLANPYDASFTLSTTVPAGTETANAATNSHQVCDVAGNCATAGPIAGNRVDKKPPTISITVPVSATPYLLHQAVAVNYTCADGGSGVASCAGPVANGGALDTTTVGTKTFSVAAADQVGNASNQTVNYTVTYNICALYDQTKAVNGGATIPIKLQLCDAQGTNVSASSLTVTAVKVTQTSTSTSGPVQDAGNANPDSNFRYDPTLGGTGGYIYNLSTKGLATGTYTLSFTVVGDPVTHTVQFQVR